MKKLSQLIEKKEVKMNLNEIEEVLRTEFVTPDLKFFDQYYSEQIEFSFQNGEHIAQLPELSPNGFKLNLVDHFGGEDKGTEFYFVFKLTNPSGEESFFKYEGDYSSWDGIDWYSTSPFLVEPKEKVYIIYERI